MIIIKSKIDTHLFFNSFHNLFFDYFFRFVTYLADGVAAILSVVILLVVKYRYSIMVAISTLVSAAITQILKHSIFDHVVRPKKFFEGIHDLYFVPGVENMSYNSFPSGHSTCAFALYMMLAFIVKQKKYKTLFFVVGVCAAYSRIYLSQHFLEDVTAGSIIGTSTAIIVYYTLNGKQNNNLDKSLINSFKK